jgi:hypothetical protein
VATAAVTPSPAPSVSVTSSSSSPATTSSVATTFDASQPVVRSHRFSVGGGDLTYPTVFIVKSAEDCLSKLKGSLPHHIISHDMTLTLPVVHRASP